MVSERTLMILRLLCGETTSPHLITAQISGTMVFNCTEKDPLHPKGKHAGPEAAYEKHIFFAEHGAHFDKAKRCFEVI